VTRTRSTDHGVPVTSPCFSTADGSSWRRVWTPWNSPSSVRASMVAFVEVTSSV
jgi:hypothetical protein